MARPGGFGRGLTSLMQVGVRSVSLCHSSRLGGNRILHNGQPSCPFPSTVCGIPYCIWLVATLFTNPVFLVFGFAILLSSVPPQLAVSLASTYVLLPLCGLIVHGAVAEFPVVQIRAARSPRRTARSDCRPPYPTGGSRPSAGEPAIGVSERARILSHSELCRARRVATLATTIDHTANQVGDWNATCQLCIVTLGVQALLLGLWMWGRWALCRRKEGIG